MNSASFPIAPGRRNVCRILTSDTRIAWIHFHPTFELCFSFIYAVCLWEELTSFESFCFKTDLFPHCRKCPDLYLGCDLDDEAFLIFSPSFLSSLAKRSEMLKLIENIHGDLSWQNCQLKVEGDLLFDHMYNLCNFLQNAK